MSLSTFCRKCSKHFKIDNSKGVVSHHVKGLDDLSREAGVVRPITQKIVSGPPPSLFPDEAVAVGRKLCAQSASEVKPQTVRHFQMARASSRAGSSISRRHAPRTVGCFHCEGQVEVTYAAKSAVCPDCGRGISLSDFEINKPLHEDVSTRGNITINKLGSIQAESVVCHNLKAYGALEALVRSTGDVMIRTRAKFPGGLSCKSLMVGRDAHVTVQGEVFAEEMQIDGHITAEGFRCSGTTKIDEHGSVNGPLKTKSVVMEDGGGLNGALEIVR